MKSLIQDLRDFHEAADLDYEENVNTSPSPERDVQIKLIEEELDELKEAYADNDPVAVADAITDLAYVTLGAYLRFGMGDAASLLWEEVHRSNMTKVDGTRREDGKLLKGETFQEPRIEEILHGVYPIHPPRPSMSDETPVPDQPFDEAPLN